MNEQDKYNKPGIYRIRNILNNKIYIGSSINIKKRFERHKRDLKMNSHSNLELQRVFNKYGNAIFQFEIIISFEEISIEKLRKLESEMIEYNNLVNNGYNQMIDNSSHFIKINKEEKYIENNKKRNSISVKAFNRFTGKLISNFNSISDASIYFKTSSSNISRICKGSLNHIKGATFCYEKDYDKNKDYSKKYHSLKNRKLSDNHILKLEKKSRDRLGTNTYKYDLKMNLIDSYDSMSQAEKENNLTKESLRRKINKETPFEGFIWKSNKI